MLRVRFVLAGLLTAVSMGAGACGGTADPCVQAADRGIACDPSQAANRDLGIALCQRVGLMTPSACSSCLSAASTCAEVSACSSACRLNDISGGI